MEKLRIMQIGLSIGVTLCFTMANAALLGVNEVKSSAGTAPAIIAPPSQVTNAAVNNTGIQGFDEAQKVTTTEPFAMDKGEVLPAGSLVDSHMIFLNPIGNQRTITHVGVQFIFSGEILGVMSDIDGKFEAASTEELGSDGTIYDAPYYARGMESDFDHYSFSDNILTVRMQVVDPGDWIRVISSAVHPGAKARPYVPILLLNNNE